eukprot:3117065-Rhodomonas_salina.1
MIDDVKQPCFGFKSFTLKQSQAQDFKKQLKEMFPIGTKQSSINNAFRRFGFNAENGLWDLCWDGIGPQRPVPLGAYMLKMGGWLMQYTRI